MLFSRRGFGRLRLLLGNVFSWGWAFLVIVSVYLCCPCAGRHLLAHRRFLWRGFGVFFGLSLCSCRSIGVAPVRGGTYFSLSLPKKSRQKKGAEKSALPGCVTYGEWHPVKCRPRRSHHMGPRTRPSLAQHTS